jgi:hypothetical protein
LRRFASGSLYCPEAIDAGDLLQGTIKRNQNRLI